MAEISLYVTRDVVNHVATTPANQQQITYRDVTADIAGRLREATRENRVQLRLGNLLILNVGDTGAIWRSHNDDRSCDFDSLFSMLARYPDRPMRFLCSAD
jgi:hypothetical protein